MAALTFKLEGRRGEIGGTHPCSPHVLSIGAMPNENEITGMAGQGPKMLPSLSYLSSKRITSMVIGAIQINWILYCIPVLSAVQRRAGMWSQGETVRLRGGNCPSHGRLVRRHETEGTAFSLVYRRDRWTAKSEAETKQGKSFTT